MEFWCVYPVYFRCYIKRGDPHLKRLFIININVQKYLLGISLLQNEPGMITHLKCQNLFWVLYTESPSNLLLLLLIWRCQENMWSWQRRLLWRNPNLKSLTRMKLTCTASRKQGQFVIAANHRTTNLTKNQHHEYYNVSFIKFI